MSGLNSFGGGFRALVIGASGGIGRAVFEHLAADPAALTVRGLSRRDHGLDITDEAAVAAQAAALAAEGGDFDLIFCATGALTPGGHQPEKSLKAVTPQAMTALFAVNTLGPALVLKHFLPLLARRRRAAFALLSARVGSIGDNHLGGWLSYRVAKAGLNQVVRTVAIEAGRSHPQAVLTALHPGTVATALSEAFASQHQRLAPADSAARLLAVVDRLTPAESGGFFAYDGQPILW